MKFSFLVVFLITVVFAMLVGIMYAFFTAPKSVALEENGLKGLISVERDAVSDAQRLDTGD